MMKRIRHGWKPEDHFPDQKEVDETRKWYYGVWFDIFAVAASIVVTGVALIWILFS